MGEIKMYPGGRLTDRAVRHDGWTKKRRAAFLDLFAATCNVTASCRAVGMSRFGLRQLRRRDAGFALLYDEAIELAQGRLKEELLARSLNGTYDDENPSGERAEIERAPFDPELAIRVLRLFDGSPGRAGTKLAPAATQQQVDAALMKRLDALNKHLTAPTTAPAITIDAPAARAADGAVDAA